MTRLVRLIFIAILLLSCKESKQNRIARLVNEWNGKIIQFPDSMCLTSYRNDTAIVKYIREQTPYTILNYVDTIGCVSCTKMENDDGRIRFSISKQGDLFNGL